MHTPPIVALFLTVAFVIFLFRRDNREEHNVTSALWLPVIWMLIIGSRFVSEWLQEFGLNAGGGSGVRELEEGSPIDALVFFGLIAAGFCVLYKRRIRLAEVVRNNRWLTIYLVYCLVSILWSDFPLVAIKRWVKILGHPIMVLIVLTEANRIQAVTKLMKRGAFVLIPISVLFVKYYPEYGRRYSDWTGQVFYTGVTTNKNALGYLCISFGFFFTWQFLRTWAMEQSSRRRNELLVCVAFLSMTLWLLVIADAKTALITFLVSSVTAVLLGTRWVVKKYIGVYVLAAIITALVADLAFGAFSEAIGALGRDPTLTDRSQVWNDVLAIDNDPVLGTGFESFWLGERLQKLWEKYWWRPNQAHNGYIETYLNLGMLGVLILAGLILSTFRKVRRELLTNPELGRFRFPLLIAILLFNYTDAIFKALHPLWFVFYLIAMDYPQSRPKPQESLAEFDDKEHEPQSFSAPCSV
jgi:exopolysaccharide production protein ExoQ